MTTLNRLSLALAVMGVVLLGCPSPRPVCGNGKTEAPETCDDGNTIAGDGCENNCTKTGGGTCGNGSREGTEKCDDGNQTPGDGCENDCTVTPGVPVCGDGTKNQASEECDDANTVPGDGCENDCTFTPGQMCGNGMKEGSEICDDGNTTAGDGCENDCTRTPSTCGNGMKEGAEQCDDGNMTPGDGCENDCTATGGVVTTCDGYSTLPTPAVGSCDITTGDNNKLITGVVLAPDKVLLGGQVLVNATGQIVCVDCNCTTAAEAAGATKLVCPKAVVSPGLINSHDHISYQAAPYSAAKENKDATERYEHRHDWRVGGAAHDNHTRISNGGNGTPAMIRWSELRQLMSGTTSIVGATYAAGSNLGLIRNLDTGNAGQEGLGEGASGITSETFPLGDVSTGTELTMGCAYPSVDMPSVIKADSAYLPHISEGIEASAQNEFRCLSGGMGGSDVLGPRTSIVHGIALKASDVGLMANKGTALVWSPRSNVSLYGDTAQVPLFARLGVNVSLGTDWVRSGSMNLLRELKCADDINTNRWNKALSDETLWRTVTSGAADATQTAEKIGRLQAGKVADIAIFRQQDSKTYRSIIDAAPADVVLVMRGGKTLFGDQALVNALGTDCEALDVCGTMKSACVSSELSGTTLAALTTANASTYPLFSCTTPADEPTCTPERAARNKKNNSTTYTVPAMSGDADADGIPDAMDNCPSMFNPVRPMDNGVQADADGDGQGDLCDVCPFNMGTMCAMFDPNDSDGDGVPNATDNCPNDPNTNQSNIDMDDKGDVCDPCPMAPNPGNSGCPATIYAVKTGMAPVGQKVSLANVLVTAVASSGFFVQVHPSDMGFTSADNSGLYVYNPGAMVQVGDRVDITEGTPSNYFGQIQLTSAVFAVKSSGGAMALPMPVQVTPAEVATGGARAQALESVLVRVGMVTVTSITPPLGTGDQAPNNEFQVDSSLRVNDLMYLAAPFPAVGQTLNGITGILNYRANDSKLEPRNASDLALGPATVAALEPAQVFVREGASVTLPAPLLVRLSNTEATDVPVSIVSAGAQVTIGDGGLVVVPAGQLTAAIPLTGVTSTDGGTVAVTATRGTSMQSAQVRVIGATETPTLVSLTPPTGTAAAGGVLRFTATLSLPAAVATDLTVAVTPAGYATAPATVTVPADQTTVSFDVTLGMLSGDAGTGTVTVSLGATMLSSTLVFQNVATNHLVISEMAPAGPGGAGDEFVELYNPTSAAIDVGGWKLQYKSATGATYTGEFTIPAAGTVNTVIPPGGYFLIAGLGYAGPPADFMHTAALNFAGNTTGGHVRIGNAMTSRNKVDPNVADTIGYGTGDSPEGTAAPSLTTTTGSFERKAKPTSTAMSMATGGADATAGNALDTDNNANDFVPRVTRDPQNTASPVER